MSDNTTGDLIAHLRKKAHMSRGVLGQATGYSEVMVGKIETGKRRLSDDKVPDMAKALGISVTELRRTMESDASAPAGLKIAEAVKLAKRNSERANSLKRRTKALVDESRAAETKWAATVESFSSKVSAPYARHLMMLRNVPDDIMVPSDAVDDTSRPDLAEGLRTRQVATGRSLLSAVGAGAAGAGAGGAIGATAAAAAYSATAAWGTASTGAAIAGLSGAASSSATLAALGGGSLAAGGLGVAGGTALLTGIVAAPILLVTGFAVVASGGRVLSKQQSVAKELDAAEKKLEADAEVARTYIKRTEAISEVLEYAVNLAAPRLAILDRELPTRRVPWTEEAMRDEVVAERREKYAVEWRNLDPKVVAQITKLTQIVLACATVLALRVGLSSSGELEASAWADAGEETTAVPALSSAQIEPAVNEAEGDFIDFAIAKALDQIVAP